jgi:serine/threonine protein kinase
MASQTSGRDLLVGIELGHYHVVEKIGAGGMGEVYRARHQHLARDVATIMTTSSGSQVPGSGMLASTEVLSARPATRRLSSVLRTAA